MKGLGNSLTVILVLTSLGEAAELRLKPQARCRTSVVTLADVAEVITTDAFQRQLLGAIELGPAPAPGGRRYVRAREVQDAVWTRGVNLTLHQFSGAEQVEVTGPVEAAAEKNVRVTEAERERAQRTAADLIVRHLRRMTTPREPFEARVELDADQASKVLTYGARLEVEGGETPWTGRRRFHMSVGEDADRVEFDVEAEVSLPPGVLVLVKSLPAGSIIHEADVALKPAGALKPATEALRRVEDAVGQEVAWSMPVGTVLTVDAVRRPQVVRRGEAVTLYARSAGLRVRTTVRARENGGVGDLITVESLTSREPFYARVTGVQEAEVFAGPAEAAPPTPASAAKFSGKSESGVIR